jgi:hypothetical protein
MSDQNSHAMKDPDELIFFSRKQVEAGLKKQEGFAIIRDVAAKLLGWGEDIFGSLGDEARKVDEPLPPETPPPTPKGVAEILKGWSFAGGSSPVAKVATDSDATLSTPAEPFPRWDVAAAVLLAAECEPYKPPPGPKHRGNPANASYQSNRDDPCFRHELTYEEYRAHNLEPLYWHQRRFEMGAGVKMPFVVRLKQELGEEKTTAIVNAVNRARALLPDLPTEGKGAGRFTWTKWTGLGKETRPLVGEGWMFAEHTRTDYARWLYQEWFKGYSENLKGPGRLPHMAALKTLYQEGAPSSLNTYDSCIMTWGVGFACGAPQIVAQLLGNADIMNTLYACGFLIQGFEKDGVINTIPGFHYQTLDLSDPTDPKVLVWDNFYHCYARVPGQAGTMVSARPRNTVVKDDKGRAVPAPSAADPEKAPAKLALLVPPGNPKYSLTYSVPSPQANLEFSFHIYNHMTLKDSPETAILKAFITVARDERTRAAVSEANRTLIVKRAMLPPSLGVIYTEAAYTFVSMCKHNWGLTNAQLEMSELEKHLTRADLRVLTTLRDNIAKKPADFWETSEMGPPTDQTLDVTTAENTRCIRHAMMFHDAIIAKAVVRKVMWVIEWDRLEQAKRTWLKAQRDAQAHKDDSAIRVRYLDEGLRKYSLLWRFDRIVEYWRDMMSGENWLTPMRQAQSIAGVTSPEVAERLRPRGASYCGYTDVPLGIPVNRFKTAPGENEMSMAGVTSTRPNWRGNAYYAPFKFAPGAPVSSGNFYVLGDRKQMKLPEIVEKFGQNLVLININIDPKDSANSRLVWEQAPASDAIKEPQMLIVTDYIGKVLEQVAL